MNGLTRAENDSELITTWLLHQSSKLTRQHYQSNIKQFIRFIGLSLEEVKIEDINGFVRMLELKGNKPSTIKGKLSTVKSLFSFAYKVGYLTSNVTVLVKSTKVNKRIASMRIEHEDIRKMVDGTNSKRDRLIIKMMFFLGLRVSEVLRLKWSDFYQNKVFISGKGNKERSLNLPEELFLELSELKSEFNPTFVFTAYQKDEQLKRQAVNIMLNRLKKRLGIDANIHPHKFRHEHSMTSLDNGCDIHLLSRSLGHGSVSITESYYLNGREKQSSSNFITLQTKNDQKTPQK